MEAYLRLLGYLRPHRSIIAMTWLISMVVLGLQALTAWIGAGFIERIIRGNETPPSLLQEVGGIAHFLTRAADTLLTRSTPFASLATALGILVGTGVLTMLLRIGKTALFARIIQSVLHRIRVDMFGHLTRLDLMFAKRQRSGEIASLFTRDTESLRHAVIDLCDRILMQPVRLIVAIAILWSLSPRLTLIFAVSLVACGVVTHLAGRRVHSLSRRLMERVASWQGFLTEYLTTVLLARSLGRETVERKHFDELCGQLARADTELTVMDSLAPHLVGTLFMAAGAVIALCGGYSVLVSSSMPSGVLLRFVLCLPLASYPVETLSMLYVSSRRAVASATRIFVLLDQPPAAADRPDALEPPACLAVIEFDAVRFEPDGRRVLDGVSFRIEAGAHVLISGPSGAGKTTVLHLLAGVIHPQVGRVTVNRVDLTRLRGEAWRNRIGIVPQEPLMMNGTIRDNLRFACESADDAKLVEVLKRVLFEPDEPSCRLALDRPVGNRGEMLSGGERQRLAIGRALLNDPLLLLLDEPVAHLDPASRLHVKETLRALPKSVTVVFTSHDRALHDLASLEIALHQGRIAPRPT